MSVVGYARVSTKEQDLAAQEAELVSAGAIRVFADHGQSSRKAARPGWVACQEFLREGDTLVVRRLDRVAGTERMAVDTILGLAERGVGIRSLAEPDIDTSTAMGRAMLGMLAVFAQLRVDTIRENTVRGLEHARSQGRVGGQPTKMTPERTAQARRMRKDGLSIRRIAKVLGVGSSTVSRGLARAEAEAAMEDEDTTGGRTDYDPMVYDALRETAARLRGEYVARGRAAGTEADRQRWSRADLDVAAEVDAVDHHDERAVRAKTAELSMRLRPLLAEPLPEDASRAAQWDRLSEDKKAIGRAVSAALARGDLDEVARLREQWFTVSVMEDMGSDGLTEA